MAVIVLMASFFVPGGSTGAGWTLYPPQAILPGTSGAGLGIIFMLVLLAMFIVAFTVGGLNYVTSVLQARCRGMTMMRMPLSVWGIFMATILGLLAFPALLVSAIMMGAVPALVVGLRRSRQRNCFSDAERHRPRRVLRELELADRHFHHRHGHRRR